jgi:cytochrome c-type biogenesis protein CcmF
VNGTIGYGLVLGGLAFAAFGALVGLVSGMRKGSNDVNAFRWVVRSVIGFSVCLIGANLVMVFALVTHDFSVKYVAQVGSRSTPLAFTIVSLWSALEGSILFWGAILASYVLAFTLVHRREAPRYMSLAVGTMLAVGVFFAFLIAGPANPFPPVSPVPLDGPGPNPLLQNHILMVIHPPMLYLGYVGMVVPFGVAAGGLLRGELSEAWMVPLRRWTLIPFGFLSTGIILGAWWAYAVLGWGGYWAWDPVENASLLPWLTTTAFIHSTMVQERRQMLKLWTLSLALGSFLLTILGTFMTRSGVFNSVHSFTQSDIGPTFLVFIGILLVFSIVLIAVRGPMLVAREQVKSLLSREFSILLNNLLFTAVTFTVLLGTLFPLLTEALQDKRMSVGEPYFNKMALPPAIAILFLMGVGPVLPWGAASPKSLRALFAPVGAAVVTLVACLGAGLRGGLPLTTFALAAFVVVVTLRELFLPVWVRMREHGEQPFTALVRSATKARRRFGGYIVHLGIVFIFIAVAASSAYVTMGKGTLTTQKPLTVGQYQIQFKSLANGKEPHRDWIGAELEVVDGSGNTRSLTPKMNFYERSNDPIGTPAVWTRPGEDLYISLLAYSDEDKSASLNVWIFPLVGWMWWSIPILLFGTAIAAWPSRKARIEPASTPETEPTPSGLSGAL